jgi:16S rRNA C967 or C1407 C5-methylase (RsmB/RsmF family)
MMIKHAMKCEHRIRWRCRLAQSVLVPNVQKIVYSTCSIHAIEDEHVVRDVLKSDEAISGNFTLAPSEQVLPQWTRRGLPEEMDDASKW